VHQAARSFWFPSSQHSILKGKHLTCRMPQEAVTPEELTDNEEYKDIIEVREMWSLGTLSHKNVGT